jgi:large subunit ribosomal protein L19
MEKEIISPVHVEARKKLGVRAGDTVRVMQKIEEKGKTRLQVFEGLVLFVKHGTEPGATFTVRKVASGVGVEKTFPLYSPMIDSIEIVKRTKVRRSKLYYIREKAAKEIRRAMRNAFAMGNTTKDIEKEEEEKVQAEEASKDTSVEVEVSDEKKEEEVGGADESKEKAEGEDTEEVKEKSESVETSEESKEECATKQEEPEEKK